MSASLFRSALRGSSRSSRPRFASTSTPVEKASEAAASAQAKASSVASSASTQASAAASSASSALASAGSRASSLLGGPSLDALPHSWRELTGRAAAYREPVMSRLAVGREVAKQVYIAERLAPPSSVAEVQSITSQAYAKAQDPRFWQEAAKSGQLSLYALYALEAYCPSSYAVGCPLMPRAVIFKIGEIIGRRSLVGYRLSDPAPVEHA